MAHRYVLQSDLFGRHSRAAQRWHDRFFRTGSMRDYRLVLRSSQWHNYIVKNFKTYVKIYPMFCIEKLQTYLRKKHPNLKFASKSKTCRSLDFDLKLTRTNIVKATREATPEKIRIIVTS